MLPMRERRMKLWKLLFKVEHKHHEGRALIFAETDHEAIEKLQARVDDKIKGRIKVEEVPMEGIAYLDAGWCCL
jgi:hypothetical protein